MGNIRRASIESIVTQNMRVRAWQAVDAVLRKA
jgi:hypothetical protein